MAAKKIFADRYECLRRIGEGGMAHVYLALDKKLNREVAIKVMHEHMREKSDLRMFFDVLKLLSIKQKKYLR